MKAYKLTDENSRTKNNTQWGENVTHSATGQGTKLCSDGWIHFYKSPLLAVFMNPIHGDFSNPILWECECSGEMVHEPTKSGCKTLTTIRKVELPSVTTTQRVAFGILAVKKAYKNPKWNQWADNWLSGKDRTDAAADAAAADAAADYAAYYYVAYTIAAAYYAAYAAHDISYTAYAAAYTAADTSINLQEIAEEAMKY